MDHSVEKTPSEPSVVTSNDMAPVGSTPLAKGFHPQLNTVLAMGALALGLHLGLRALTDNSFFTHLATGRLVLESGSVPSIDPYSFTAHGEPWTVQSWGASVLYAGSESLGGLLLVRLLITALTVTLALLVWHLTARAEGLVARLAVSAFVLIVGVAYWNERPLLFGLVGLALVLLASDDRLDPRWLVPIMWIWVNTHGSFPFAVLVLVLLGIGRRLDGSSPAVEVRAAGWCIAGVLLGAVNPIGPRLLSFPLTVLQKRESFALIVEWKAPTWNTWEQRLFAVQVILAVVIVIWRSRSWRAVLPLVVFAAAAGTSLRNIPPASLVMAPAMAAGLVGLGSIDGRQRTPAARIGVVAMGALCVLILVGGITQPHTDLRGYPVEETTWMRDRGLLTTESRVITLDTVGNYLEARYGPQKVRVFIDDRVDMYPTELVIDYSTLLAKRPGDVYQNILEKYEPTAVLWKRDAPFAEWIKSSASWTVVRESKDWVVAVPA